MIHADDIEKALGEGDGPMIERAFGVLVDFPQGEGLVGARSVDTLCGLLMRVVRALDTDGAAMPEPVIAALSRALDAPVAAATYAAGSRVVAGHAYRWRGRYLQHAANGGSL